LVDRTIDSVSTESIDSVSTESIDSISTKPIDSALVNEFILSLSRITALDWDIPSSSYSCFNEVFSRADLSLLQRLYIGVDHFYRAVSWLEALTIDQRHAKCFLPRLQTIYIGMHGVPYAWLGRAEIFKAVYNCLRSRRFPLEDDGESGVIQVLGHDNTCALLEIFTWEGSLRLKQHQTDALKGLIDGGLRINLVAVPANA